MKLTLRTLLILAAAGLGVFAIICMFMSPVQVSWGEHITKFKAKDVFFGNKDQNMKPAILSVVGFAFIILGGLIFAASLFTNIGDNQIIMLGAIGLMILGGILVFCTKGFFCDANSQYIPTEVREHYKLGAGTILGGLCGIFGGLCGAAATFVIKD
ncbi:MAG: hypothetical protein IJA88_03825 [Clostridia bacterium]|nr:hypothetical protein [Clostridia bacterium]